jgi:uncharacterized protein
VITYYDTSALVPLLLDEPGTAFCEELWASSDVVISSRLLYAEAAAAIAASKRQGRCTWRAHAAGRRRLDDLWPGLTVIDVDEQVVTRAAVLAHRESLRGYDAVHCASAESVNDATLVVATGDRTMLAACARLGMTTADTAAG